jgi:hypothetical protein
MARPLSGKANIVAPGGSYPYGRVKDKGMTAGTPVDEVLLGDMIQFFEKLMNASGIAFNNLPENSADGFQFFLAMQKLFVNAPAGGPQLLTKVIQIGDWNMDRSGSGSGSKVVLHGLGANYVKIRMVQAMIIDDASSFPLPLDSPSNAINVNAGISSIGPDPGFGITLGHGLNGASSKFDNNNYDAVGFNRGWVTVLYEA